MGLSKAEKARREIAEMSDDDLVAEQDALAAEVAERRDRIKMIVEERDYRTAETAAAAQVEGLSETQREALRLALDTAPVGAETQEQVNG
jgi:hypothetical protein